MLTLTKWCILISSAVTALGCAHVAPTGTLGINFGMNPDVVMRALEQKDYAIVSHDKDIIVARGIHETTHQPAIKVFEFEQNKLVSTSDKVLDGTGKTFKYDK